MIDEKRAVPIVIENRAFKTLLGEKAGCFIRHAPAQTPADLAMFGFPIWEAVN